MDMVSLFERTIVMRLDALPPMAAPTMARVVEHLLNPAAAAGERCAGDGPADEQFTAGGRSSDAAPGPVSSPDGEAALADGETAMALGLGAFEAAERLRGVVDAAQLGALARLHASAQAVFDSAVAQCWVGAPR